VEGEEIMAKQKSVPKSKDGKLFGSISSVSGKSFQREIPFRKNDDVPKYLKNLDKLERRSKKSRIEIG